jgi:hypothetical protein
MRTLAIISGIFILLGITAASASPARQPIGPFRNPNIADQSQDIEQLAFAALVQAATSAQEDLRSIMAHVKAINAARARQRQNLTEAQRAAARGPCESAAALRDCIRNVEHKLMKMELASLDLMRASVISSQSHAALLMDSLRHAPEEADRRRNNLPPPARIIPQNPCRGWNVTFWRACVALMQAELNGNLPDASSQTSVNAQLGTLKQDFDPMSELGETESLRLQMVMGRMSKLMSTLSNILKKISGTAQSVTGNLK